MPRGQVCEKMCARCPFRSDGSGYAQDHPDLPNIVRWVELGLPFYCHETVILDKRTKYVRGEPSPAYQPHFVLCRGGHEYRMKKWEERTLDYLAAREKGTAR